MFVYVGGAIIVVGLVVLAAVYAVELRRIGISDLIIIVPVGSTYPFEGKLAFKPRWEHAGDSTIWRFVPGVLYYKTDPNQTFYSLQGASSHQLGLRGHYRDAADLVSQIDINGLQVGNSIMSPYGWDDGDHYHSGEDVPVVVIAAQQSFAALYNAAVTEALTIWSTGWLGNTVGGTKCNEWADWIFKFTKHYEDTTICKIEKVYFAPTYWVNAHVCVRIELCDGGGTYYLDPHKFPNEPRMEQAEYERRYRSPTDVQETWSR